VREDLPGPESAAIFKSRRAAGQARSLRKSLTPAERELWWALRRLPVEGSHFRKQAPFGPYVVDFICHGARLVIEVDGGAHLTLDRAARDLEREQWIASRGYRVIRFKNARALADAKACARDVWALLKR
jgi:very-short-patch-repair endonuclease